MSILFFKSHENGTAFMRLKSAPTSWVFHTALQKLACAKHGPRILVVSNPYGKHLWYHTIYYKQNLPEESIAFFQRLMMIICKDEI